MVACVRVVAQANLLRARQPPAGEVESYAPNWEALGSFMIDNYERGAYAYVSRAGRGKDENPHVAHHGSTPHNNNLKIIYLNKAIEIIKAERLFHFS